MGVPFSLILTISDLRQTASVFNELRQHLLSRRVNISDIGIAPRVRSEELGLEEFAFAQENYASPFG